MRVWEKWHREAAAREARVPVTAYYGHWHGTAAVVEPLARMRARGPLVQDLPWTSLTPVDLGYDPRRAGLPSQLPSGGSLAVLYSDDSGGEHLVCGPRDEVVAVLREARYEIDE